MTELEEKITKLESILSQVPKGTPTYETIRQSLDELKLERSQASSEISASLPEPPLIAPEPSSTGATAEKKERPVNESMFQAIGVIKGQIETESVTNDEGEERILLWLVHQGKRYRVKMQSFKFKMLLQEHQKSPNQSLYFRVYPYLQFIPKQPPELRFQINGWQDYPHEDFQENEFILRGIWQFIPQFRRPLITVMRNWMDKKNRDFFLEKGIDFKGIHVPLLWKDSPVPPFRFNPKAQKQGDRYFVEMKAKFIPKLDTFGFVELLSEPTTTFPRHLLSKVKMAKILEKQAERKKKQNPALAQPSQSDKSEESQETEPSKPSED
jgi:hypothetical protein